MLERIKELCNQNNITVQKLEKALNLGNGTIRRWGETQPAVDKVLLVANYFGVSIDFLINGTENPPADSGERSERDQRLISWFYSLPEEKRQAILTLEDGPKDLL